VPLSEFAYATVAVSDPACHILDVRIFATSSFDTFNEVVEIQWACHTQSMFIMLIDGFEGY
jgi:hypothetical protein